MNIFEKYKIDINNNLVQRAFTHSSYVNETKKGEDYERLEFLGDKILDFIISEYLYVSEHLKEGEMTKIRACYVCENALYAYSKRLNFSEYLKLGKGEEATGGRNRKAILADVFEAFLASVYLVYGLERVKTIVYDVVVSAIENEEDLFLHDYKSALQELLQSSANAATYEVIDEQGPSHDRVFTVIVKIDDLVLGQGIANSKKEAEQRAAKDALSKQAIINNN